MGYAAAKMPRRIVVSSDPVFLTVGEVRDRYSCSAMWISRHIREHGFPKPVRFGGKTSARRWRIADIEAWEAERFKINSPDNDNNPNPARPQ